MNELSEIGPPLRVVFVGTLQDGLRCLVPAIDTDNTYQSMHRPFSSRARAVAAQSVASTEGLE